MKRVQEDSAEVYLKFAFRNVNSAILLYVFFFSLCVAAEAQQPKKFALWLLSATSMKSSGELLQTFDESMPRSLFRPEH